MKVIRGGQKMNWDLLELVIKFAVNIYHAGGAKIRWVVWFWAAFVFLYLLLGQYDAIHKRTILAHRHKKKKNYFYALHLYGICTAVLEYGYLLEGWPICYPMYNGKIKFLWLSLGFALLAMGFVFVILGRLYLNSYWGKDIFTYENKNDYQLITDHVYSCCRHPIYFGQISMCFGTALVLNNYIFFFFAILMLFMNFFRANREDQELKECFGDVWKKYKDQVCFFFP